MIVFCKNCIHYSILPPWGKNSRCTHKNNIVHVNTPIERIIHYAKTCEDLNIHNNCQMFERKRT